MALPSRRAGWRWRPWVMGLSLAGLIFTALSAWAGLFDASAIAVIAPEGPALPRYRNTAVVYLSGDTGLNLGFGQNLAHRLSRDGLPVVTVNSLTFFRRHRRIEEVSALVRSATAAARALRPGARVMLVGHSLGADALQASLATFGKDERGDLGGAILIVPTQKVYLRVSQDEMLNLGRPDAAALPSLRSLTWLPVTCIYGSDERHSPCPALTSGNVAVMALPGGHGLNRDVGAIHRAILHGIDHALEPADHPGFR